MGKSSKNSSPPFPALVHTVGTLCRNQGEPLEIRNPGLMQTGDVVARDNGQKLVMAWKDKQVVKAIKKYDASVMTITRQKKRGVGKQEQVRKPVCIEDYHRHVCSADRRCYFSGGTA